MYTGIVQATAPIERMETHPGRVQLTLRFPDVLLAELKIGASVSVEGVCLTVTRIDGALVSFDAVEATLAATNLGDRRAGDDVNIERSAKPGDEVGGHAMAGHVFGTATVVDLDIGAATATLRFRAPAAAARYIFPMGFLGVNGASLTVAAVEEDGETFRINLIPETLRQTTFRRYRPGDRLNLEIDHQTRIMVDTIERCFRAFGPAGGAQKAVA